MCADETALPLLSSLPETSTARCEADVAELLAVQLAMKSSIFYKWIAWSRCTLGRESRRTDGPRV